MSNHLSQAEELKSQGAIEAARNPDSQVSAGDAERTMVDETTKAGGAAYQFDPNASPEEKAAQARSVSYTGFTIYRATNADAANYQHLPADFHHRKEPKGIAIATDIVRWIDYHFGLTDRS